MPRLPVVISCTVRNFKRVVSNLVRPYDPTIYQILADTTLLSIKDLEPAVLGYYNHDTLTFLLRGGSDDNLFYGNDVQKICSTTTSIVTNSFMKYFLSSDPTPDINDVIFETSVFTLPSINEAVNFVTLLQKEAIQRSLNQLVDFHNLERSLSFEEKFIQLSEVDANFYEQKHSFIYGVYAYKSAKLYEDEPKYKWGIYDAPNFLEEKELLFSIIKSGHDD